jgi:hypothetical protein
MKNFRLTIFSILVVFCSCLMGRNLQAQSAIVNAPSTDVVAAKKLYVEMDFITNYAWQRGDARFANYLPRAVVGIGPNVEVGANVSYTRVPGGGAPVELQPNAKWQFYSNEGAGVAAVAGCIWFVPVTHRLGTNTFGQCYSLASKKFKGTYGPRFTGGAYRLIGANDEQHTKAGAIIGYEQPLSQKVGLIIDWASGQNRFGYVSPALNFVFPNNGNLSAGYAIANHGRGNNNLFLYYGQQF